MLPPKQRRFSRRVEVNMIPFQLLALAVGTTLIRFLHLLRRRLGWKKYFSFSDLLVEEQQVTARGFLYMALPPFLGGVAMGVVPSIHPATAAAAGLLAAFIGVWPVFQFTDQLLDEHLIKHWSKLKFLYVLFVGFSTSLAYTGFVAARTSLPLVVELTGTTAWQQFLDNLAANAIYDSVKTLAIAGLIGSGLYVTRERKRIGAEVGKEKEEEWEAELRGEKPPTAD
jgi:hypothetical protein